MILISAPRFQHGLGLDIHIRTKIRYEYSHIQSAALKIGDEILEVGGWGEYLLNGIDSAAMPNSLSGFAVMHEQVNDKVHKFTVEISKQEKFEIKNYKDMVAVKIIGAMDDDFEGSLGLMGNYVEGKKIARDGQTAIENVNEFGQEWQVLDTDPKLFEASRLPQYPVECRLPLTKNQSRRLGETIAEATAREACSGWGNAIEQCVYDGKLQHAFLFKYGFCDNEIP